MEIKQADFRNTSWISSKWSNVLHQCIKAAIYIMLREYSDSLVELFSCEHVFNYATGINTRVNQQVAKPSICPRLT